MRIPGPLRTHSPAEARLHVQIAAQLNAMSEGRAAARYAALAAAPTTGTWARGDEVKNSAPSELGTSPNKYVIDGWKCVAGGTPGTWVQMRFLTGN
jgi:hypothetical protein